MRYDKLEVVAELSIQDTMIPSMKIRMLRESHCPAGCKRVWRGEVGEGGRVGSMESHSRKKVLDWAGRVARGYYVPKERWEVFEAECTKPSKSST